MKLTRALGLQHFLEASDIKNRMVSSSRQIQNKPISLSLSLIPSPICPFPPLSFSSSPSLSFCVYLYLFLCSQPPWYWLGPLGLTSTPGCRWLNLKLRSQLLGCPLFLLMKELPWRMVSWSPFSLDDSRLFTLASTRHCLQPISSAL